MVIAPLTPPSADSLLDRQIARRLKALRAENGWSLETLAARSGVSRATLSRLENAAVSPTAAILGKLCAAYGLTVSRLMHMVEDDFDPLIRKEAQAIWTDPETGARRCMISPPAKSLAAEALEGTLMPGTRIVYDTPPRAGLEHHLVLLEGELDVTADGQVHRLKAGDCLRYQLFQGSTYATPDHVGARYLMFVV